MNIHYDINDRGNGNLDFTYWLHNLRKNDEGTTVLAWFSFNVELELLPALMITIAELSLQLETLRQAY